MGDTFQPEAEKWARQASMECFFYNQRAVCRIQLT